MERQRQERATAEQQKSKGALEAMGHLHRLSSLIASDHLDEALSAAMEIPVRCLGVGGTALLLPVHASEQLKFLAGCNLDTGLCTTLTSAGSDDLVGWAMKNGSTRAIDDLSDLPPPTSDAYLRHGVRSAICVPVETGGISYGAMLCVSPSPRAASVWEIELISMVANQVSSILRRRETAEIGFEYARLFEQSKSQARQLRSLYKVARSLTSTLEFDNVTEEITRYLCRHLSAEVCALVTYDRAYDEIDLARGYSSIGEVDGQYLELTKPAIRAAFRSKRPVEFQDLLASAEYKDVTSVRRLGLRSGVVAALAVKGNVVGFLAAFRRSPRGFRKEAIRVLPGLGELAAIAIENTRLYQRQYDIAHMTQRTLVPTTLPGIPGFDIGYRYEPAYEVGGDYCDIVGLRNGRYGIVVADVAGKDIAAASHIAMCRHSFRATADEIGSPHALIGKMNRLVCQYTDAEAFISMVYAILNPATRKLTISSAGHEPALLYRAQTGEVEEVSTNGLLLGIQTSETYSFRSASIQEGDLLALYTDGLVDALAEKGTIGVERLKDLLTGSCHQPAQRIADSLYDQVLANGGRSPDDVALILLKAL